ncbi:rap1 GTPase-activating protein 1 isoform X2 [Gadus macrocephalus]|uniref:rap1 GTPase-activating protein 1 isoform X2 n=1 Tax=Gadus macrocephalus TaxID=80720 RepID=UPI0028CB1393|nr:rap1 GTPase-activating protein 1 isoform X2 [Gadus macrocephalus]
MDEEKRNIKLLPRKTSVTLETCGRAEPDLSTRDVLALPAARDAKPFCSVSSNQRVTELFEIIEKLQGSRIDEQRCVFPPPLKTQLLKIGGEVPLVLPPKLGGYWLDPPLDKLGDMSPCTSPQHGLDPACYDILERDSDAKIYREFFGSLYHHTFIAVDASLGPLVLSVCLEGEAQRIRVILRMMECSLHGVFSLSLFHNVPSAVELAKRLCENVTMTRFEAVSYLKAPELIIAFDEHRVSSNFKFGILLQKEGQFTEEDILSNTEETQEFQEFLSILGETVKLQGFTGFRGGLDVSHGQTGDDAVVTSFQGRHIMFHVATKLPFTEGDPQQLQRKRHIGNDIVALVYQEGKTPFISDIISSHFLHCFLVVRKIRGEQDQRASGGYQVCVTARDDVPPFGPVLPDPPIFTDSSLLRQFLLTKLINAEISCYKAERFSRLELRTRSSLLEGLQNELSARSQCMLGDPSSMTLPSCDGLRGVSEGSGGFIENFKRAIRVRSHSFDTLSVPKKIGGIVSHRPKTAYAEKDDESEKNPDSTVPVVENSESANIENQQCSHEES